MERDFYTDEFEDLIKLKADQYRMYPSEKVWKGIRRSLHSNRKKYWFGFALLLTGLSYFGIDQLIVSPPAKPAAKPATETNTADIRQAKIIPFDQVTPGPLDNTKQDQALASKDILPSAGNQPRKEVTAHQSPVVIETELRLVPVTINGPVLIHPVENPTVLIAEPGPVSSDNTAQSSPIPGLDHPASAPLVTVGTQGAPPSKNEDNPEKTNWLQEYAVYDLVPVKAQRINWQVSFAPTMNYRRMTGQKNANIQSSSRNIPIALSIEGDLDKLVNHKPALGFELGSFLVYSLTHNLALKGGLQFNYTRYEIQAYSSATERATISLNSINGLSSSSISNFTQLRNFGGYAVQELENQYFQVSVPLGFELNILGSNKLQLGVAGTVQPTYLLNRNTYLISSDYKNYTKEPSLLRKWNVHTAAETFVSYRTAGLKWQVGPQIRYQLFSSYTDKYPIKEYLIEYGVKIGVTKTIR